MKPRYEERLQAKKKRLKITSFQQAGWILFYVQYDLLPFPDSSENPKIGQSLLSPLVCDM
jgi:hypothetical protein